MRSDIFLAIMVDLSPSRQWWYHQKLPHRLQQTLSSYAISALHVQKPANLSGIDRQHYELTPKRVAKDTIRFAKQIRKRLSEPNPYAELEVIGYQESLRKLLERTKTQQAKWLVIVPGNHVAVIPEAVDLTLQIAEENNAELVYAVQVTGLLPVVVSTAAFEKWVASNPKASPRIFEAPEEFAGFEKVVKVELVDAARVTGETRCWMQDAREVSLLQFWQTQQKDLAEALAARPDRAGAGRDKLTGVLEKYRAQVVSGLETYHVVGDINDVHALRRQMQTSGKPILDYFVVSTHYKWFLEKYAGLKPSSRVLDIGCSWGYLGIILASYLNPDGGYLGVEVQPEPVEWAQKRLGWLGANFKFLHVDIRNTHYNPAGTVARGEVRLPVSEGWADVIVLGSVFTHMQEDGVFSYLKEFRRLLSPTGIAAFSYLDSSSFWSNEELMVAVKSDPDKRTVFSRAKMEEMVKAAGLKTARPPVNMHQFERSEYQTWYFAGIEK